MKAHEARNHFLNYLKQGNHRNTPERFEVFDAVLALDEHFDAEGLYMKLKASGSKVSRATVYKTLNLLYESGLVSRYRFAQGNAQYEKTVDRSHHDHLICTKCGKVIEFENPRMQNMHEAVSKQFGFKPIYHSVHIFGVCKNCQTGELIVTQVAKTKIN